MKKLEEIPKKAIFEVPDGYFHKLPGVIQARITENRPQEARPYLRYALQYALPVVVLLVAALIFLKPAQPLDAEGLLASVSTEELATYLEQSDMSLDELLENATYDDAVVEAIEAEAFMLLPAEVLDDLETELDNL
ncbi:MAG: hypothetical protein HRU69_10965 [Flammeovirgaceae bacterium]|nr:MAG: hypothetical protein HRU69_10965 [Flammeovirgaceae bacterium]